MSRRKRKPLTPDPDSEYYILPLGELGYRESRTFDLDALQRAWPLKEIKQEFYKSMIIAFTFDDPNMYTPKGLSDISVDEAHHIKVWIKNNKLRLKHRPGKRSCRGIFMHYGTCGGLNLCLSAFLLEKGSKIDFIV